MGAGLRGVVLCAGLHGVRIAAIRLLAWLKAARVTVCTVGGEETYELLVELGGSAVSLII